MRDKFRKQIRAFQFRGAKIPEALHEGIVAYIVDGITPGGFFTAIVCNDLRGAFQRADVESVKAIHALLVYMLNEAPSTCWGSVERMVTWQRERQCKPLTEADWLIV
jgi:hypothetical protein